jgi:hypothetical protein
VSGRESPLGKNPSKKVDMKSIVPYFMCRNEYFEPATVVDRAAPVLRGGCGLIIRSRRIFKPHRRQNRRWGF